MTSRKLDEGSWSQSPAVQIMAGSNKSHYEIREALEGKDNDRISKLCLHLLKCLKRNTKIYLAPFGVRENILKSLSLGVESLR